MASWYKTDPRVAYLGLAYILCLYTYVCRPGVILSKVIEKVCRCSIPCSYEGVFETRSQQVTSELITERLFIQHLHVRNGETMIFIGYADTNVIYWHWSYWKITSPKTRTDISLAASSNNKIPVFVRIFWNIVWRYPDSCNISMV